MKDSKRACSRFTTFAATIATASALAVQATQIRPVNLEEMTARAARIFSGRCTEISRERDPGLGHPVMIATFEVHRTVKGAVQSTVRLRMLADGSAGFRPGEDVVLFLYGESALGLTSPVGFGQGKFTVFTDKLGRRIAVNEMGNRNLFRGLSPQAVSRLGDAAVDASQDRADLDPAALLQAVEALTRQP
jgi:hypothetical protein